MALPVQTLGAKHPNDPTVTTLEQESATVTDETIADATAARLGNPAPPAGP
jgi:hypothetical protein